MSDFEISERKLPASPDFLYFFVFTCFNTLIGIKKWVREGSEKKLYAANLYSKIPLCVHK